MAEEGGDKSQEATPHRRQQAREKGQVPQSQDLASAVVLVAGISVLIAMGQSVIAYFGRLIADQLGGQAWIRADREIVLGIWNSHVLKVAEVMLPILGLIMLMAVAVHVLQTGLIFLPDRIQPDLSRLSIFKGVERIFSLNNAVRLAFGLFKMLIVSAVAVAVLWNRQTEILALTGHEAGEIATYVAELVLWTSLKIGLALLILALLDYGYQRWKFEQDLKMTSQEVREEMKDLQGDPQVIARRRSVQRQLVLNRLSKAVPKADVVITNPTELAVAIQYLPDEMAAPIVVAKGADLIAKRIRQLALENNIPIVEKKPLAQALYRDVDVNHPIPAGLYAAVAEVLAYVYQLKGKEIPKPNV